MNATTEVEMVTLTVEEQNVVSLSFGTSESNFADSLLDTQTRDPILNLNGFFV